MHEHLVAVTRLVSHETSRRDDSPAVLGWLQRMCRAAARDLPASGVGVNLLVNDADPMTAASSPDSELVEELQFAMGEGPCLLAHATREPVLVPDLAATARTMWPGYAPSAYEHGVRAVFAFPLQVGRSRLGAIDVYRRHTGHLTPRALGRALAFATVTTEQLLLAGSSAEGTEALLEDAQGSRYEVYQAQGMVMAQLSISADDALARLRAHAFLHGRRLLDVAQDVISRRLSLERDEV